jgi:nitrogen fixation protein FixH
MNRPAWIIGPALVGVITMSTMIGAAALIYHAHADPSFAVETDYYDKAVHWDASAAQQRRSAELGWRLRIAAGASDGFELTLTDGLGLPIDGASVAVEAFHNARSADRITLAPKDSGGGVYRQTADFARPGLWEFRVIARRGEDTFTAVRQIVVSGGEGAPR